jgi:hypothetical protein
MLNYVGPGVQDNWVAMGRTPRTSDNQEAIQPPSGSISGQISESNGQGVLYGPSPLQGPFGVQIINQLQDGV